jgi:serine/threonine protein kinase
LIVETIDIDLKMIRTVIQREDEVVNLMLDEDSPRTIPEEAPSKRARIHDSDGVGSASARIAASLRYIPVVLESLDGVYALGMTIGRGEFAKVKIATCLSTGRVVAIKLIDTPSIGESCTEKSFREVDIHWVRS